MTLAKRCLIVSLVLAAIAGSLRAAESGDADIRVNQVGYLPDAPKVAVVCALTPRAVSTFVVVDTAGRVVFGPRAAIAAGAFGPCVETYRLDFSALRSAGTYRVRVDDLTSPDVRIGIGVWNGLAEMPLRYMRQQR
jgi:endoglucanase